MRPSKGSSNDIAIVLDDSDDDVEEEGGEDGAPAPARKRSPPQLGGRSDGPPWTSRIANPRDELPHENRARDVPLTRVAGVAAPSFPGGRQKVGPPPAQTLLTPAFAPSRHMC